MKMIVALMPQSMVSQVCSHKQKHEWLFWQASTNGMQPNLIKSILQSITWVYCNLNNIYIPAVQHVKQSRKSLQSASVR